MEKFDSHISGGRPKCRRPKCGEESNYERTFAKMKWCERTMFDPWRRYRSVVSGDDTYAGVSCLGRRLSRCKKASPQGRKVISTRPDGENRSLISLFPGRGGRGNSLTACCDMIGRRRRRELCDATFEAILLSLYSGCQANVVVDSNCKRLPEKVTCYSYDTPVTCP